MSTYDIKYEWRKLRGRDTWPLTCIVIINIVLWFVALAAPHFTRDWLGLPNDVAEWLRHPWTLVTYMFVQWDPWHVLCNMLVVWWFGTVLLISARNGYVWCLYLTGGLVGGLVYLLAGYLGLHEQATCLVGSSASMLAIVCAVALRSPDYKLRLLLVGEIRMQWIALIVVVFSLIGLFMGEIGSGLAHIGGIIVGVAWGLCIRRGYDLFGWIMRPKGRRQRTPKRSAQKFKKKVQQARENNTDELDRLLDKVRVSGYESLSQQEKDRLRILSQDL